MGVSTRVDEDVGLEERERVTGVWEKGNVRS